MLTFARPVSRLLILNCLAGPGLAGVASQALALEATPGQAAAPQDSAAAQPLAVRRVRLIRRASLRRPKGPPGRIIRNINPQVEPAVTQPGPVRPVPAGPLAPIGAAAEAAGINLHLLFIDAYYNNFDMGVIKGISANTGLVITGADFDMGRIAGITGGTFHVLETIQTLRTHINNFAPAYGDLTAGFEPVFPATASQLSVLSYEQKLLDGAMTVEVGRSNPNRAFNLPVQGNFVSNWNNVWYQSAGAKVPTLASWMARVSYNITPAWYVQAGAYEDNPRAVFQYGFDWDARTSTGALALAEVGYKTDFTTTLYPSRFELLGFYNSSQRTDPAFSARGRSIVFNPTDPARTQDGSAGFIFNAQRVVWRADGGAEAGNLHPTSFVLFGSVSAAPYGIVPVTAEAYGGFTLQSPLQSRPYDSIGMKFHWTQLSNSEQSFLEMSNLIAGGTGYSKSRNSFAYELNAHIQLAQYVAIEPTIQYFQNANNFYNPRSARVARDGFFFGGTLQVALGQLLGLSSAP